MSARATDRPGFAQMRAIRSYKSSCQASYKKPRFPFRLRFVWDAKKEQGAMPCSYLLSRLAFFLLLIRYSSLSASAMTSLGVIPSRHSASPMLREMS